MYSATTNAIVPTAITIGITANHISKTFLNPSTKTTLTKSCPLAFLIAWFKPCEKLLDPAGITSSSSFGVPSKNISGFFDKGGNLGKTMAATKLATVTVK